ncbi:4Fe-4S ferredoxin [Candidatus Woesearchaeota archaeon CG11_big_fil_rev_8_21_14_0_20_43_8]|nr:MAG: 4Fe-4S ferredoxin [Candidatus Woesearchaeota archaeon CG11_big_fil_rev_8_21_14_0_20_43_8]PIO05653.1 MAG: 4Fe-4S ferredoxin [Candidatus Woesearchaeota archaeon CG08_land_8_20_14_0_20_43_7]
MPKVKLDPKNCTLCGTCTEVCPMEVFEKTDKKISVKNESECIACRSCEVQCPKQCIKIED